MGKQRWTERAWLLILLLAVGLPAVALIAFNATYMHSMKRDRAFEAAIQRDSLQMLSLTEKHMTARAYELMGAVRREFPAPEDDIKPALMKVLAEHPYAAYLLVYDEHAGVVLVASPKRMEEPGFRAGIDHFASMISNWMATDESSLMTVSRSTVGQLWWMQKNEGHPYRILFYWGTADVPYQTVAFFPLPKAREDRIALGAMGFDSDYLKNEFFPSELNDAACPPGKKGEPSECGRMALMVHPWNHAPLAASTNWDGGKAEVDRPAGAVFPGLWLSAKLRGTTIQALGQRVIRLNYIILGCLSVLLVAGIFLTYRNVGRELGLAKLKSDFVSNVSHELRTPLSLIRLYAETLELGRIKRAEKYQEYYCIIRKESERLTALINNILDFSRIEAGKKEYDFRETDIAELVQTTVDSYRYQIEQNGFTYEQKIEEDLPKLQVDREAIARSLLNLMNNAFKYSSDRKYLGINLYRSNGSVHMEVVDRGIGISRAEQEKIFDKFYRASDPLVHNSKGSGLGLSLVRHVVRAHHGEVGVESTPGQGSKFTIVLPVPEEEKEGTIETA